VDRPSELDIAQLKHEMRELYRSIGFTAAIRVAMEMMIGARVLMEVIVEEWTKEKGAKNGKN
jgi:hypothetical protein